MKYFSGLGLLLLFCLLPFAGKSQKNVTFNMDKEFKLPDGKRIDISLKGASVKVSGSERDSAHIRVDRKKVGYSPFMGAPDLSVEVVQKRYLLTVRESKEGFLQDWRLIYGFKNGYDVVIELPRSALITLSCEQCKINLKDITGQIRGTLIDSEISLAGCGDVKLTERNTKN